MVALGRSLRGHESDLAFPLVLVLEELEEIALQLVLAEGSGEGGGSRSVQRGCIWRALLRIGLGHDSLMQTYCGILLRRWQGRPIECQIVLMASASACLMDWVHRASGYDEHIVFFSFLVVF